MGLFSFYVVPIAVFLTVYLAPCNTMFVSSFLLPCSYDGELAEYRWNQAEFLMVESAKTAWAMLEAFFMYQVITIVHSATLYSPGIYFCILTKYL